jgi:formyltetrahydrofolate synthetase
MELQVTSFRMLKTTKEKLEHGRHKMSKAMNCSDIISWDTFFDVLMNIHFSKIENSFEKRFDLMQAEQNKIDTLSIEMKECFKQQNSNTEELVGKIVKALQTTNEDLKFIKDFNKSMNDDLQILFEKVSKLLNNIGDMTVNVSQKIERQIKKYFGISIPIILHYIVRDNSLLLRKFSNDEAIKEVNKTVSNYKNLYNSASAYSDDDIDKLMDKYSMKEQLKK